MYYFAWAPDGNQPFSSTYHRVDEDVYSFTLEHVEGEFPSLKVEIKNPHVGMLRSDRDQWVWFSKKLSNDTVVPIFHGRLVAIPEDIQKELVSIEFVARPSDFETQKTALAESMKVFPWFDRVWIPEENDSDLDAVLEGYSKLWHIGRTDKTVTASEICVGEGETYVVGESDIFADTMSITYGSAPYTRINVEAQVSWDQKASGSVVVTDELLAAFQAAGSSTGKVSSYTGQGLESDWPFKGTDTGGGWKIGGNTLKLLSGDGVTATYIECPIQASTEEAATEVTAAKFYLWVFGATMSVDYAAERARSETLNFHVLASMQDIDASAEPDPLELNYSSARIVGSIDAGGAMPIGNQSRRTYFGLDRGVKSIEYLLCVCRANFMKAARAVEIGFEVDLDSFINISCKDNFLITSSSLPNGEAQGKVIGYTMSLDGDSGAEKLAVTIGATIGRGSVIAEEESIPTYSDGDYDGDYEVYAGGSIEPVAGQIAYTRPVVTPDDDGVDFDQMTPENCINFLTVENGVSVQAAVCAAGYPSVDEAVTALNAVNTKVKLSMVPVEGGPFELDIPMTTQKFTVPKTIDLEA